MAGCGSAGCGEEKGVQGMLWCGETAVVWGGTERDVTRMWGYRCRRCQGRSWGRQVVLVAQRLTPVTIVMAKPTPPAARC